MKFICFLVGAFNALLKTLEEPPEHVKFILATTEPQKLPATILSRCQRFDFKRISNENIVKRLEIVCMETNIEATKGALNIIAILSEGAMRDALSILERCVQDGDDKIDEDKIKDLVGIPKIIFVNRIAKGIIEYDVERVLESVNEILEQGKDINNLLWELIKYIKDILIYKSSKKLQIYNEEELKQIEDIVEIVSKERLVDLIYQLSELENNIKWSNQKTIMFQAGIIKLCNKQANVNSSMEERVEKIEKYLKSGNAVMPVGNQQASIKNDMQTMQINQKSTNQQNISNNTIASKIQVNENVKFSKNSQEYWPQIVKHLRENGKIVLYTNLINTTAKEINDMTVGIEFPNGMTSFGKAILEKQENVREIATLVSKACGKEMQIKYIVANMQVNKVTKEESLQNLANESDIPFNIVE